MHVNGTQTRLDSKQRYRTIRSGYKETISDLSIANFGKTDEGQYTCRLTRPYVDWTADAKTYLQMESRYQF